MRSYTQMDRGSIQTIDLTEGIESTLVMLGHKLRDGVEDLPIIGLRRAIAEHLQQSKRRIPHFSYIEEVDVTALEELRAALNTSHPEREHLTLLPFLMRAIANAAADHKQVNARYDDEAGVLHRHEAVHIGVATQTEGGLLVPVVVKSSGRKNESQKEMWLEARMAGPCRGMCSRPSTRIRKNKLLRI